MSIFIAAVALSWIVVLPQPSAWENTRSYEALYLHVKGATTLTPQEATRVRGRLDELRVSREADLRRRRRAATLVPVIDGALGVDTAPTVSGRVTQGRHRVTPAGWTAVSKWILTERKAAGALLILLAMNTLAMMAFASIAWGEGWMRPAAVLMFIGLMAAAGVPMGAYALRLDLLLYARWQARAVLASSWIESELEAVRESAKQTSPRQFAAIGRWVLVRR